MRLYKANLNNNYNVISYVIPDEIESIYSIRQEETYDISLEAIQDYLELSGYITTIPKETSDISFVMFVDIDYNFISNDRPWLENNGSYVKDQITSSIRKNLIDAFFDDEEAFVGSTDTEDMLGIVGQDKIFLNEMTYVFHKYKGGIWESDNPEIINIDKYTGVIKGKAIGKASITYQIDTGTDILICYKDIEVIYEKV